jgi:hypothetical protein
MTESQTCVRMVRGVVRNILDTIGRDTIALLHIDLNSRAQG